MIFRTIQTAQYINYSKLSLRSLDEIDAGICDSMTYTEIAEKYPEEFSARAANKLKYRYPQGFFHLFFFLLNVNDFFSFFQIFNNGIYYIFE